MYNEPNRFSRFIGIITIILFVMVIYFGSQNLNELTDRCDKMNGTIVKGSKGWICIDGSIIE